MRQQVGLEPSEVIGERGDDGRICLCKFGLENSILRVGKGKGHIVLEELNDSRKLLDGDLSEDARRILKIRVRFGDQAGHELFRARSKNGDDHQREQTCAP